MHQYAVKVRRHTPWSRVRCHGSHECWFTHRQFHSRRHSLRITLKSTTLWCTCAVVTREPWNHENGANDVWALTAYCLNYKIWIWFSSIRERFGLSKLHSSHQRNQNFTILSVVDCLLYLMLKRRSDMAFIFVPGGDGFVSWEPEGRCCRSKMFHWEPEGTIAIDFVQQYRPSGSQWNIFELQ